MIENIDVVQQISYEGNVCFLRLSVTPLLLRPVLVDNI